MADAGDVVGEDLVDADGRHRVATLHCSRRAYAGDLRYVAAWLEAAWPSPGRSAATCWCASSSSTSPHRRWFDQSSPLDRGQSRLDEAPTAGEV